MIAPPPKHNCAIVESTADGGVEQVRFSTMPAKVLSSFVHPGHQVGEFTHGQTLAVDSKGNIYVAETDWGRRIQEFEPVK
jgi:hypothetical protein